jgi:cytochrome c553
MMNYLTLAIAAGALALSAAHAADPNLARNLAATCANCHGTDGHSQGEVKALAAKPAQHTLQALAEFKSGQREATIMHQIVKGFSDEQLKLIADYFAQQK